MDIEIPIRRISASARSARILGVEPYVVRYWETEFKTVKPIRTKSEQRLYRRKDLEALALIRNLLYRDRFTIAGAKKRFRNFTGKRRRIAPPTSNAGRSSGRSSRS